jgi:hypothetical protein
MRDSGENAGRPRLPAKSRRGRVNRHMLEPVTTRRSAPMREKTIVIGSRMPESEARRFAEHARSHGLNTSRALRLLT